MQLTDIGQSTLDLQQTGEARLQEICDRYVLTNASYAHIDTSLQIVHGCTTFPTDWVNYYTDNNLILADPLIRYGASTIAPLEWSAYSAQPEYAPMFEAAKRFGVGCQGISIPTIGPFGNLGLFTVTSNLPATRWQSKVQKLLPELRHEAQLLHLLALDVIDITLDFPAESLSGDERDVLRMLAAGLSPQSIARQIGFSSGLVNILTDSIMTKFRSNTIEQAVGRAVSVGTLLWTDFFANPVLEVVDRDQRVLLGGIVYWTRNNYEIISFDRGRQVRDLASFVPVEAASLSERFLISIEAIAGAFGEDADRKIWVKNL